MNDLDLAAPLLPAEPGWWPPAPGWWLLAALLLGLCAALWHGAPRSWSTGAGCTPRRRPTGL